MEETSRNKNRGEFYTPKHISDLMYNTVNKYIPDFSNTHIVWDCCWGTGNLTEGREFKDLYCSTLQRVDIRKNKNKNKDAVKFQYDFLNQDIEQLVSTQAMWMGETSLPESLDKELRDKDGKPIIIYINPPYISSGIQGTNDMSRAGQTESFMKDIMREHKMQSACDQAYAQFLYKIILMAEAYANKNISIAVMSPYSFLTTKTYERFRNRLFDNFKYEGGVMFPANEFKGLSNKWGITVQVYTPGVTENRSEFPVELYKGNESGVIKVGDKVIYNLDNEVTCMEWAKEGLNKDNLVEAPFTLSSGCKVSDKKSVLWDRDSIGYMFYRGNNLYHNEIECGIMRLPYNGGSGISITRDNIDKLMVVFCARRAFARYGLRWDNDKDEYCVPNTECKEYEILKANAYLYNQLGGSMHMSSLCLTDEYGDKVELPNEFNFMSLEVTKGYFDKYGIELEGPGELKDRFIVDKFNSAINSGYIFKEGLEVFNEYLRLWELALPYRKEFNERNPEYQVMNWDAGYYQVKWVIKEYFPEEFKNLRLMYRKYEELLRPLVKACGFFK